jgi:hypothetical protein
VLFFGKHGLGAYCYGPGTSNQSQAGQPADGGVDRYCYDPDSGSKGVHNYPYASYVWAYDANDLVAGEYKERGDRFGDWDADGLNDFLGEGYDPATRRLFVSQVGGDSVNSGQPLIRVYQIQ